MPSGNDCSVVVDPTQVITRAVRDRHLHCTGCLDGAGAGLCRLSLLLQRLEPKFYPHCAFQTDGGFFFSCDKSF